MSGMDPTALLDEQQEEGQQNDTFGLALVFNEGEWKALPLDGVNPCDEQMLWDFCWHYVGLRIRPELNDNAVIPDSEGQEESA